MRTNLSPFGVVIFLFSFTEQTIAQLNVCPPWFIPDNTSCTGCSCHQETTEAQVYCGQDFPLLHFGYCMTYNNTTGATEYGPCPYTGHYSNLGDHSFYIQLPSNVSLLNEFQEIVQDPSITLSPALIAFQSV